MAGAHQAYCNDKFIIWEFESWVCFADVMGGAYVLDGIESAYYFRAAVGQALHVLRNGGVVLSHCHAGLGVRNTCVVQHSQTELVENLCVS